MVIAKRGDRVVQGKPVFDIVERCEHHATDDPGAHRRTQGEDGLPITLHDGWRHAAQRPLARCDGVPPATRDSELVRNARLGGKVIHLVVQNERGTRHDRTGAKPSVDGLSRGNDIAPTIGDGEMRGLAGLEWEERKTPWPAVDAPEPCVLSPSSGPAGHIPPEGEGKKDRPSAAGC